MGRSSVDAHL